MRQATTRTLSRLRKPADLSLDAWQRELRRQFGREQPFTLKNTVTEPVFSDFHVSNPQSASTYRVARRLNQKPFRHVLFHGGLDGSARKALIERFRHDDGCRAFLSTDAGGVGLNLQHASVVVNMDVPWNPAVLEQRIGRVHRLGQRQPVRVINFVAQGTIEEGMLSVLKFKKSLFAGVLDGGEREVFLGGSRLTRFMETVEKATAAIAEPGADDREEAQAAEAEVAIRPEPTAVAAHHDWTAIVQTGLTLLDQLAGVARTSPGARDGLRIVHRDPGTGQDYLKIPLPSPEMLDRALEAISQLLRQFRR